MLNVTLISPLSSSSYPSLFRPRTGDVPFARPPIDIRKGEPEIEAGCVTLVPFSKIGLD